MDASHPTRVLYNYNFRRACVRKRLPTTRNTMLRWMRNNIFFMVLAILNMGPHESRQHGHEGECHDKYHLAKNAMLEAWDQFVLEFNKSYASELMERAARHFFFDQLLHIAEHNKKYMMGEANFHMTVNTHTDVPDMSGTLRLNSKLGMSRLGAANLSATNFFVPTRAHERLAGAFPVEFDWRNYGFNTSVPDQGLCGSCWAFAVKGALEGVYNFYYRNNVELSAQQLLDCCEKNFGCEGGWIDVALQCIEATDKKWLQTEGAWPYVGVVSDCRSSSSSWEALSVGLTIVGAKKIAIDDETALEEALVLWGPVPAAMHATQDFFMYSGGIFEDSQCEDTRLNHAILIVGFGVDAKSGHKYWILKNSWGEDWGENGYVRLRRGMCGITQHAFVPQYIYSEEEYNYLKSKQNSI